MNNSYQTLIIGGGLSGLTVAHKLRLQNPKHDLLVIDKAGQTGGVIQTNNHKGYITEIGPHGFLDNCQESKQILAETGLDQEAVKAPLIDFVRYVYLGEKLNLIPQTPLKIMGAPLIPWSAKLRVLAELWQPPLPGEPTVAKWVHHRFGPALLPYLDAVYTGTYAGDFDKLVIDSVMPGLRALEKEHGSILRGLINTMRQKRKDGGKKEKIIMPAMTSFPEGMQRLTDRLAENLHPEHDLLLNTEVVSVQQGAKGWQVATSQGSFQARNVVMGLPANAALKILNKMDSQVPEKSIPECRIATVVFGYDNGAELPPGFGFLTPEVEKRFTLGALFSSNMFPGRAPKGHIVFETLIGGRRHPERLQLDDQTLTREALKDIRDMLKLPGEPAYTTILRSPGAIPQFEKNYQRLLAWRKDFVAANPGLHICGFGWEGIGINDMMKGASKVAANLLLESGQAGSNPEVKGIYF